MAVVASVVLALVFFVSKSILGPLRQVQEATRRIAQGTFVPLAVKNDGDEIQQVFVALNSMVEELKKRQTQLVQAQKLSSIGTLASGIAHQLNNPLNNISTSAQILEEETAGQNEFADKMMHNITQETLRARDIVKGLLEFSRHKDFSPSPCNLKEVLSSAGAPGFRPARAAHQGRDRGPGRGHPVPGPPAVPGGAPQPGHQLHPGHRRQGGEPSASPPRARRTTRS